jgi:thiosulfate dehydrogenase [quinone] large subunit
MAIAGTFSGAGFRARPVRTIGMGLAVLLRWLFGLFFLLAGINKLRQGWLWSDRLHQVFTDRLAELDPVSSGAAFLTSFGIPWYVAIAWVVTVVELGAGVGLLLGFATRISAGLAFWLMVMIGIGGYYDASLLPLWLIALLLVVLPTGHWLGMDRRLHAARPGSLLFR